jgi:hypothetical protein
MCLPAIGELGMGRSQDLAAASLFRAWRTQVLEVWNLRVKQLDISLR